MTTSPSTSSTVSSTKKRQPARTSTTNVFVPFCRTTFTYKDENAEPVKNRYIAYWLYDKAGKKIENDPTLMRSWDEQVMGFPVSIGKTDETGLLKVGFSFDGILSAGSGKEISSIYSLRNLKPAPKQGLVLDFAAPAGFPLGRKVGFLLLPIDTLNSITTGDLQKLKAEDGVTIVTIEKDQQSIPVKCTLPEWQARIDAATKELKRQNDNYQKYIKKHLEAISQLDLLSSITWCMARFPGEKITASQFEGVCSLSRKLNTFKEQIQNEYINNTSTSSVCGQILDSIDKAATSLFKIIDDANFIKELKRYLPHLMDADFKGPSLQIENDWKTIFNSLLQAYVELAKTSQAEKVFDKHIADFLKQCAAFGGDDDPPKFGCPKSTPLLEIINPYLELIQTVANPAPGPVNLVEGILDVFGLLISNWMQQKPRSETKVLKNVLYGVMRLFNKGKPLSISEKGVLAKAASNWK